MIPSLQASLLLTLVVSTAGLSFPPSAALPAARALDERADATISQVLPGPTHRESVAQHIAWVAQHQSASNGTQSTSSSSKKSTQSSKSTKSSKTTKASPSKSSTSGGKTTTTSVSSQSNDGGVQIGGSAGLSVGGIISASAGVGVSLDLPPLPTISLPAISLPGLPIHIPRDENINSVGKRQKNPLNKNQWCPEFFGGTPKLCSYCGGDSKVKGVCNDILYSGQQVVECTPTEDDKCLGWYCKCTDPNAADTKQKVTSTAVVNGQTGTVVWEANTISEYAGLKASTTITLTETATATGETGIETVVAVVFAGGVVWEVASQIGAAEVVEVIEAPPDAPEGTEEDDKVCQTNPQVKCKDCGGANGVGLCLSGDQAGCPCDETKQECPTDGRPKCSAADCGGDNGQGECKATGTLQGCACCPDTDVFCLDGACKGDDKLKCQADKLKGCSCLNFPDGTYSGDTFDQYDSDQEVLAGESAVFTRVWGADPSKVPGYEPDAPYCLHGGSPNQSKLPAEYCQCGSNYATTYSVVTTGTNPCPFSPSSTGKIVTFSNPTTTTTKPATTPPPTTAKPTTTKATTTKKTTTSSCIPIEHCGDPFSTDNCCPE